MDYVIEDPPDKKRPGKPTRYSDVIEVAKADPGTWFRLSGEHHTSNIGTLKSHGLTVQSKRGKQKNKHILWVCFNPDGTVPA